MAARVTAASAVVVQAVPRLAGAQVDRPVVAVRSRAASLAEAADPSRAGVLVARRVGVLVVRRAAASAVAARLRAASLAGS